MQQLLAVARPPVEDLNVFALNDVVSGVEDLLTRLIGENIVLTKSLAGDLGSVRMDPAQVQQILLNLVLNARDAMPDGGRITAHAPGTALATFPPVRSKRRNLCLVSS